MACISKARKKLNDLLKIQPICGQPEEKIMIYKISLHYTGRNKNSLRSPKLNTSVFSLTDKVESSRFFLI
jgi:hypothetical protein